MTDSCRKHGISPAKLSGWKYGGMDAEGVRLLGGLERILDDGPSSWTFVLSKVGTPPYNEGLRQTPKPRRPRGRPRKTSAAATTR